MINYKDVKMNKYFRTYEEWQQRIKEYLGEEFELIDLWYDDSYNGRKTAFVEVKHNKCGEVFIKNGYNIKSQHNCPICISKMQVSELHAIVSLVFKKYYPNSENEKDIGFKGSNGGISRYDLFVPDYNGSDLIIEFQSRFHDDKKEFDKLKMQFAIDNGYKFYSFDARSHTPLKVVQKFFPDIKKVPKSIIKDVIIYSKHDLEGVQELLDKCYTAPQIEKELGISRHAIYKKIYEGVLTRDPNHHKIVYGKRSVILLDSKMNFVGLYRSLYMIEKEFSIKVSAIKNKNNCVYKNGYYFIYEDDYKNNNYKLPK